MAVQMNLSRRSLITGLTCFLAAPAIIRASSLMPVKAYPADVAMPTFDGMVWVNVDRFIFYTPAQPPTLTWSATSDPEVWEATEYLNVIAAAPIRAGQPVVLR